MSMYRWLALAGGLMAGVLIAPAASAQDEEAVEKPWSVTLSFLSDYRFRGISQTNEDPAVQATYTYGFENGFYAGAFASNVDFVEDDGANWELDLFLGYAFPVSDSITLDFSYVGIVYPADNADYNYGEFIGKAIFAERLTFMVGYSGQVFGSDEDGIYYGLSTAIPVNDSLTFNANVGYYDLDDLFGDGIVDYGANVTKSIGESLSVSFGWVDTDNALDGVYGENNDGRFQFGLSTTF